MGEVLRFRQLGGEPFRLELEGDIDERADFGALLKLTAGTVLLDLSRIRRINSAGCHRWVRFLEALSSRHRVVRLSQCSSTFVAQAMMVPNMVAHATVDSLYLPYWCDKCEEETDVLARSAEDLNGNPRCPKCSGQVTPDTYASSIGCLFRGDDATARARPAT